MSEAPETPGTGHDSVGRGVAIGVGLTALQILIVPAIASMGLFGRSSGQDYSGLAIALMAWGLTQFVYMAPAAIIARRKGRKETAKGIIIVAGICILLNGACDALIFGRR